MLWAASAQAAAAQPADNAADAQSRCSDLKEVELPDVVIQRVKWVQGMAARGRATRGDDQQ